jgi:hypothetical protein
MAKSVHRPGRDNELCCLGEMLLPQSPMAASPMSTPSHMGMSTDKLRALVTVAMVGPALERMGSSTSGIVDGAEPGAKGVLVNHCDNHGDDRHCPHLQRDPEGKQGPWHGALSSMTKCIDVGSGAFCISSLIECKMHLSSACSIGR